MIDFSYEKQYELCISKASEVCGKNYVKYTKHVRKILMIILISTINRPLLARKFRNY